MTATLTEARPARDGMEWTEWEIVQVFLGWRSGGGDKQVGVSTPWVEPLADRLQRTPAAVAMMVSNIVSRDPILPQKGLNGGSERTRIVLVTLRTIAALLGMDL